MNMRTYSLIPFWEVLSLNKTYKTAPQQQVRHLQKLGQRTIRQLKVVLPTLDAPGTLGVNSRVKQWFTGSRNRTCTSSQHLMFQWFQTHV